MKKQLLTLLAAMLTFLGFSINAKADTSTYTDENGVEWTNVSTASDFYSVINAHHDANVRLTDDIDLSSHSSNDDCIFDFNFTGKITGKYTDATGKESYHALMNSTKDLLFNYLTGAEISDLVIYNCSFNGWDTHSGWIGTQAYSCKFTHIMFAKCSGVGDANTYDIDCIGCLVGISHGCTFDTIILSNCSIETDGEWAGLITGKDDGSTFTNCMTGQACSIWADGNANKAYCGGLCGEADGSTFDTCVNAALVASKDDCTGGLIGHGKNTKILDCINSGIVCNAEKSNYNTIKSSFVTEWSTWASVISGGAGAVAIGTSMVLSGIQVGTGITSINMLSGAATLTEVKVSFLQYAGLAGTSSTIIGTAAVAATVAVAVYYGYLIYNILYQADEVGGIAGTLEGGSIANRSTNLGAVSCQDKWCGGIVGHLNASTIENSLNRGMVDGNENVGGIAGYCEGSSYLTGNINIAATSTKYNAKWGMIDGGTDGNITRSNNYYVAASSETGDGINGATPEEFANGSVALALNNQFAEKSDKPWHQNFSSSMYPTLDPDAPLVSAIESAPCTAEKVYTPGDFYSNLSNPYAVISIEQDLDLNGKQCFMMSSSDCPFRGKIYGNGHVIKNVSYEVPCASSRDAASNAALFPFANGATFQDFTIMNFHITQEDVPTINISDDKWHQSVEAFLVANSTGCEYTNIKLKNSTLYVNDDKDFLENTAGLAAISNGDTFTNCSLDADCRVQAYTGTSCDNALVGGIAGTAVKSTFTGCYSDAQIWADDNCVGGIVGKLSDGSIDLCLNTGGITGQESVGGIVGCIGNSSVTRCVNTGWIDDDDKTRESYRAGVAGVLFGDNAVIDYCWNYGSVNYAGSNCGQVAGPMKENAHYGEHNYWYCQYNGSHSENLPSNVSYSDITSGKYAYTAIYSDNKTWLYQSIDNDNDFTTKLPVPIADAGTVYSNILCDGTQSYSNIYKSTAAHTGVADCYGKCTTCGNKIGDAASEFHITNASELNTIAKYVNNGNNADDITIYLDNDIDMKDCDYTPIGNASYPFKGTFDGQGHRVKNLVVYGANESVGLLGCVNGVGTTIKNVVVDSTCVIQNTFSGTAGLVGCVKSTSGTDCSITIYNCGNEATVSSTSVNSGGILGGVYNNDNTNVYIYNCYNTGSVTGSSESAAIVGYARKSTYLKNCWSSGTVSGITNSMSLWYTNVSGNTCSATNCYDVNGQSGTTKLTSAEVTIGTLCQALNINTAKLNDDASGNQYCAWTQDISTDSHPTFGNDDLYYTREVSSKWGTLVLPYSITANDDVKLYTIDHIDEYNILYLKDVETVAPNTPCFFKVAEGISAINFKDEKADCVMPTVIPTVTESDISLIGVYSKQTINPSTAYSKYYIAKNTMWTGKSSFTLPAFRAYLQLSASSASKASYLTIADPDNESTAIGEINDGNVEMYDNAVYNLAGQRVNGLQKGQINIVNGKKIHVK